MKDTKKPYMNEENLSACLINIFGKDSVHKQVRMKNRTIVDFILKDVDWVFSFGASPKKSTVVVEFDGFHHYRDKKVINRDLVNNDMIFEQHIANHIIHIPYFVQASTLFPFYFNIIDENKFMIDCLDRNYSNGFIDQKCVKPIDFSIDGWNRFSYELSNYPTPVREEIRNTMSTKENRIYEKIINSDEFKEVEMLYDSVNFMKFCFWG